jgi:hypothetical protein
MRNLIKKTLKEEFDWIDDISGLPSYLKIGNPIEVPLHENLFCLKIRYFSGYQSKNFYDPYKEIRDLTHILALLILVTSTVDAETYYVANSIYGMIQEDNNLTGIFDLTKEDLSEMEEDDIIDTIYHIINESVSDVDQVVDSFSLTYFDDSGVEHSCDYDESGILEAAAK